MMENNTQDTLLPDGNVAPGSGDGAVTPSVSVTDKLNEALGKEFPDEETALKAVKDTFAHIGDVKQLNTLKDTMTELQKIHDTDEAGVLAIIKEKATEVSDTPPVEDYVPRSEFEEEKFYGENP